MAKQDDHWRFDPELDYHDPSAGIGGAPPAVSALTLRTWLAAAALITCVAGIALTVVRDGPVALAVVLAVVGLSAIVDLIVIGSRRRNHR